MAAFACRPGAGSEPGAGWALAAGAARSGHDVTLVTQPRNRAAITAAISADPTLHSLHPHYAGLPAGLMERWDQLLGLRGLQLYYLVWQLQLRATARRLHRTRPFDIAHHATMTNDWVPSGLLCAGIAASVWGPLGGSERVPSGCRSYLGARGRAIERVRPLVTGVVGLWARRQRASLLVAQNEEEAVCLRRRQRDVVVSPNVFLDSSWSEVDTSSAGRDERVRRRYRAVFVGRLVAWKGVFLALEVMQREEAAQWELHIYGQGTERRRVQSEINRLGLAGRAVLHESVSRTDLKTIMSAADALLYPSMRDAASWVVGEALAVGCPVVCLNVGGPPLLVGSTGTAVSVEGDVARNLALGLVETTHSDRPVVRWGEERVPSLLEDWYGRAHQEARVAGDAAPIGTHV